MEIQCTQDTHCDHELLQNTVVNVEDLHVGYEDRKVLNGINLKVQRGETLAILGGSGCGKSTLLNCLTGAVIPLKGRVEVLSSDIEKLSPAQLDEHQVKVGFLFQHGALFQSMTVRENLECVLREHTKLTDEELDILIKMKLELVGLRHTIDLLPTQLSGGMRKRIALARAFVLDPPLMLYDEPGAGLDPVSLAGVDRVITTLARVLGMTSIVVTHHLLSAMRIADRLVFLHEGKIIATGTPEEFCEHEDPRVRQFLDGRPDGPLNDSGIDDDYVDSLLGKENWF